MGKSSHNAGMMASKGNKLKKYKLEPSDASTFLNETGTR